MLWLLWLIVVAVVAAPLANGNVRDRLVAKIPK